MSGILITAIGGDIAQAAASIIREARPGVKIFGIDMGTRHGGPLFVDNFCSAPSASAPDYGTWLKRFLVENDIAYCLPMSEAELSLLAAGDIELPKSTQLLWAGVPAVRMGCDKLATADFVHSLGIPVPWTLVADEHCVPPQYPCIFKLRRSAGSKAVFICENRDDVRFFANHYPDAVVQEYLPGDDKEVTCAVYRSRTGRVAVLQMLRHLVGGFTGWARVIGDPAVKSQCQQIAEALSLHGSINVQLRLTPDGPRIFEVNPRLSSTLLMRHRAGFRDLAWMLDEAEGHVVDMSLPEVGTIMVRTQGAALLQEFPNKEKRDGF